MPTDFEELKRKLLQSDEEYRQLATQHHDLDEKIHDLTARHYLSEPEQRRRNHPQEAKAATQGSDGVDSAQAQPRHERRAGCPQLSFDLDRSSHGETLRARISKGSSVPIWPFCCFLATSDSIPPH